VLVEDSVLSWRKMAGATFHGDEAELRIVDDSAFDGDPTSGFVSAYQAFTVPTSAEFSVSNGSTTVAQIQADGAWGYSDVTWQAAGAVSPAAPAGVSAPQGVMGFTLRVVEPEDSVTITATLPQPVTQVWKLVGGEWVRVADAVISGTTVTYVLQDGRPARRRRRGRRRHRRPRPVRRGGSLHGLTGSAVRRAPATTPCGAVGIPALTG